MSLAEKKSQFLEDSEGNKSSSRLVLILIALTALALVYIQAFREREIIFSDSTIRVIWILLLFGTCHAAVQKIIDNRRIKGQAIPGPQAPENPLAP